MIKFKEIITHSHIGQRQTQEDSFFANNRLLIVSDGVGGYVSGSLASQIVVDSFSIYSTFIGNTNADHTSIAKGICNYILMCLENAVQENPQNEGMAATLAALFEVDGLLVATHLGDSRIYHFAQDGRLKWRSRDHSFVQQLIDANIITDEEASTHPRRNVITRVLRAGKDKAKPEALALNDAEAGDRFLLCSDGIIEVWGDQELETLFMENPSNEDVLQHIKTRCEQYSKDNNTAIIGSI